MLHKQPLNSPAHIPFLLAPQYNFFSRPHTISSPFSNSTCHQIQINDRKSQPSSSPSQKSTFMTSQKSSTIAGRNTKVCSQNLLFSPIVADFIHNRRQQHFTIAVFQDTK
jgi:hypothetical protein